MKRARDMQRSRVYRAENSVYDLHRAEVFASIQDAQVWLDGLVRSPWFRAQFPGWAAYCLSRIPLKQTQGTIARAYPTFITMPSRGYGLMKMLLLHEVAHVVTQASSKYLPSHGREFCVAYLALVRHCLGQEREAALKAAFKAHKARYKPKRQYSPEVRAAMRQRMLDRLAARRAPATMQASN